MSGKRWVHFRKLPAKAPHLDEAREQIKVLAASVSAEVESVTVLYGRGQAIIAMKTDADAARLIQLFSSGSVLQDQTAYYLGNAIATEGRDPTIKQSYRGRVVDDETISREVSRCITSILSNVMSRYNVERCKEKKKLCKRQQVEVSTITMQSSAKKLRAEAVCYEYIATGGRCSRGDLCRNFHREGSVIELPVKYRCFEMTNQFPITREESVNKEKVNKMIASLCSNLDNKRCLILDGPNSNTARILRSCVLQKRSLEDIIIPNYCFATFEKIREVGFGQPYYGSLRAYLDLLFYDTWKNSMNSKNYMNMREESKFGLIYLDYCSRLNAGYSCLEKSPIADIEAIFKYQCLSYNDGVLAICFCRSEDTGSCSNDDTLLWSILCRCVEDSEYTIKHLAEHDLEYGVVLVRTFVFSKIRAAPTTNGL
jgi:ribosomal protein L35AE/L33A